MSRHENYPDDIRSYDNVPGSPFYQDPNEWMHEKADEMATAWLEELGTTGMIEHEDWTLADLVVLMAEAGMDPDSPTERFYFLEAYILKLIESRPEDYTELDLNWR